MEMSITGIVGKLFLSRQRELERHESEGESLQRLVLDGLISKGRLTEFGRGHGFDCIRSYDDFARQVPQQSYEDLKGDIDRMRRGERDVLWPGRVKWFAKSSGTTSDRSKFIPVTSEGLKGIHYRGGRDTVAFYLRNNPSSRMFDGKGLILGGSHEENYDVSGSLVGDLSAILIENMGWFASLQRVPKKGTALLSDFEEKRDRIARETLCEDVRSLSGVPSWMLSVLLRVLELSGAGSLDEVWPHLEVFFHGGIAFTPYRHQYEELIRSLRMHYMETYNASEGFFGIQNDPSDAAMLLMLDYGVFYEFVPVEELDGRDGLQHVVPLWGVETGRNYAMMITTTCGLWRYLIGDTIMFTERNPYKFIITGRTKYFINAFGEELIMDNAERGLSYACEQTGAEVLEYTAAPVFMDEHARCRHQWLIEFVREPEDIGQFEQILDRRLQQLNSDYEAKRSHDITLQRLEVVVARKGLFDDWLRMKGKLGGQHKIPRLSNERKHIEELLALQGNRV